MSHRGRKADPFHGRAYWRSKGLCIDCGGEIDSPQRYVRCKECRAKRMEQQIQRREAQEAIRAMQAAKETPQPETPKAAETRPSHSPYASKIHAEARRLMEARREREAALAKCESCVFATLVGPGTWYCPLPYCEKERA